MKRSKTIPFLTVVAVALTAISPRPANSAGKVFRAGACAIDITPEQLPVIVSGMFLERTADKVHDPLHARCLVLDDGATRVAVVIVDSLLMPRDLLDDAKQQAQAATGIPSERMMIAATHTHSAPSVVGALGSGVDEPYRRFLPGRIAKGIELAAGNLAPAKVGWTVVRDAEHTHCRRWILRPDRVGGDPFGGRTVRAMMHPGYQNPSYVGPAGPADPDLSILAVKSPDGRLIAMLANYSMHYFGSAAVSADYYGRFVEKFIRLIGAEKVEPPPVAIMSQGTSGDLHWMDYGRPRKSLSLDTYVQQVAQAAHEAYRSIQYQDWVPLAMGEKKLTLKRRVPDEERLAWARKIAEEMQGRKPKNHPEVYALEQIYLHEDPARELKLQALRIGELGITAMPCEVFGITGLKIKAQSPLEHTFNLELANGAEGYIPPPEQHKLGGYTTWPARSAGLEVQAEPRITDAVLDLLEEVSGRPRRELAEKHGPYARAILAAKPAAYWRMGEPFGPQAADAGGQGNHGRYEDGVAFYLPGPPGPGFCGEKTVNRAAHFAGGRMKAVCKGLGNRYSVEMWLWNGLPNDARPVTGYLFSRGVDGAEDAAGDHLGIGGTHHAAATGKLIFVNGKRSDQLLIGTTELPLRTWNHVVLVRDGENVAVYLNGDPGPEVAGRAAVGYASGVEQVFLGGRPIGGSLEQTATERADGLANFEGKIDEVSVYDRALTPAEVAAHYKAAGRPAPATAPPAARPAD